MREVLEIARRGRRNEHLSNKRMSKEIHTKWLICSPAVEG